MDVTNWTKRIFLYAQRSDYDCKDKFKQPYLDVDNKLNFNNFRGLL